MRFATGNVTNTPSRSQKMRRQRTFRRSFSRWRVIAKAVPKSQYIDKILTSVILGGLKFMAKSIVAISCIHETCLNTLETGAK